MNRTDLQIIMDNPMYKDMLAGILKNYKILDTFEMLDYLDELLNQKEEEHNQYLIKKYRCLKDGSYPGYDPTAYDYYLQWRNYVNDENAVPEDQLFIYAPYSIMSDCFYIPEFEDKKMYQILINSVNGEVFWDSRMVKYLTFSRLEKNNVKPVFCFSSVLVSGNFYDEIDVCAEKAVKQCVHKAVCDICGQTFFTSRSSSNGYVCPTCRDKDPELSSDKKFAIIFDGRYFKITDDLSDQNIQGICINKLDAYHCKNYLDRHFVARISDLKENNQFTLIRCVDCGKWFRFDSFEKRNFERINFAIPKRCYGCRGNKNVKNTHNSARTSGTVQMNGSLTSHTTLFGQ